MGCDIHTRCEVFNKDTKTWEIQGRIFKNPYWDKNRPNKIDEDGYQWNPEFTMEPFGNRDYDLFAILADVRNGRGFAGIKTSEGFNPISEPKGIPIDISKEGLEFMNSYDSDGHSHSYFTVEELKNYDWGQVTVHRGCISMEEYKILRKTNDCPNSWAGYISGPDITVVDEDIADLFLNGEKFEKTPTHVNYHWTSTYKDSCIHFLDNTIPELEKLGEPNNVRIIFFFDN